MTKDFCYAKLIYDMENPPEQFERGLNPLEYPEDPGLWPGESPLLPGYTRLYRGEDKVTGLGPAPDWGTRPELARKTPVREDVRFFTQNRFDAENFAHMLTAQGHESHVVYLDMPVEQVKSWSVGKKNTGEFPEVLVPAEIAKAKLPIDPLPDNWRSLVR